MCWNNNVTHNFTQSIWNLFLDFFSGPISWTINSGDRLNWVIQTSHPSYPAPLHAHSQSHTKRYPSFTRPYVCMNLQGAICQWHSFNNKPRAVRMTYSPSHPFVFCWVMCLLIPRIFSGACVLCSAGNMRRNSNDSASWCGYCHGVTMAWVESQFIWLILCCCDSFCLSLL